MTVQYSGGYFLHNENLVRGVGGSGHTATDMTQISNYTVNAVNYVQETAWTVNGQILNILDQFLDRKMDIIHDGEVVLRLDEPINPATTSALQDLWFDPEVWDEMSPDDKKANKQAKQIIHEDYKSQLGEARSARRILSTAREMWEFDKFYFPHNMDFRTRIYPIPSDLTPQSSDLAKGLLRFAKPTRLGSEGVYWMGFTVATHFGEDKLHPDERMEWAVENLALIGSWVDDPMKNRGWLKADKPFQFLAVAYEWVFAWRLGDPEDFMSHLPGNLDGSCNGAQHLSVMACDLVGAKATNCMTGPREDLYMEVADRVWEQIQIDAANDDPMALKWSAKMSDPSKRRKVVKRSVMTVPYGVTARGVADFMIADKHVEPGPDKWDQAKYMRDLILEAVDKTLNRGKALQAWFMECAALCAENNLPLCWDTPAGSKVTQAYRNLISKRITSFDTRFLVYMEPDEGEEEVDFLRRVGIDKGKMATAAPPNVVHSCDASHLQITVNRMHDIGIRDFSMIHDSFGCPFAHVGTMRDILRQSMVDMYDDDYLAVWKESVERYSGLTMPDAPELGLFNVQDILKSEFFFS